LFENLTDNVAIDGVFKDVYIHAYINTLVNDDNAQFVRGIKFPYDLFSHNPEL
jgi:hypothetical protein